MICRFGTLPCSARVPARTQPSRNSSVRSAPPPNRGLQPPYSVYTVKCRDWCNRRRGHGQASGAARVDMFGAIAVGETWADRGGAHWRAVGVLIDAPVLRPRSPDRLHARQQRNVRANRVSGDLYAGPAGRSRERQRDGEAAGYAPYRGAGIRRRVPASPPALGGTVHQGARHGAVRSFDLVGCSATIAAGTAQASGLERTRASCAFTALTSVFRRWAMGSADLSGSFTRGGRASDQGNPLGATWPLGGILDIGAVSRATPLVSPWIFEDRFSFPGKATELRSERCRLLRFSAVPIRPRVRRSVHFGGIAGLKRDAGW
jgi:hypothetical protein